MYKIKFLLKAREDISDIYRYIAKDNPIIALEVNDNIRKTIWYLLDFPFIWTKLDNWLMKIVDTKYKYNIIYIINSNTIEIVAIFKNKDFNYN